MTLRSNDTAGVATTGAMTTAMPPGAPTAAMPPLGHEVARASTEAGNTRPQDRRRRRAQPAGRRTERAEGVISTAISVLIIAFLGIALWSGFNAMMNGATDRTRAQVEQIGN